MHRSATLLVAAAALCSFADAFSAPRFLGGVVVPLRTTRAPSASTSCSSRLSATVEDDTAAASASAVNGRKGSEESGSQEVRTRPLGSQELLMLPRQYSIHLSKDGAEPFPQMNHVCAVVLSSTPPVSSLRTAVENALASHPLLRAHVSGSGEPDRRIDLFRMVREGNPSPETFVSPPPGSDDVGFGADDVLAVVDVPPGGTTDAYADLRASWERRFRTDLDDGSWCDTASGPLWKVELHRLADVKDVDGSPAALVLSFNHAISDQSSANLLLDQILSDVAAIDRAGTVKVEAVDAEMPLSLEESVLGVGQKWDDVKVGGVSLGTVKYVAGKAAEGLRSPVILPDTDRKKSSGGGGGDGSGVLGALSTISGRSAGGTSDAGSKGRRSAVQFRNLGGDATDALLARCRSEGVSVTNALAAAVALTATDYIDGGGSARGPGKERNYKVLQSLDMRRFGERLDACETVACMAGSMDLMLGPLLDRSGEAVRTGTGNNKFDSSEFWNLAREGKKQTSDFIESGGPSQATRVFDFAMSISDMNNLVHLTSESAASQGRAYSAGVTNVGVYERQRAVWREGEAERESLMTQHGKYKIKDIYFATPHTRSGSLYQVSCMTVNGDLKLTFHPAAPVVSEETNAEFADAFVDLLEIVSGVKEPSGGAVEGKSGGSILPSIPPNSLSLAALALSVGGIAVHGGAWMEFFKSVGEMKAAVDNPEDFWAALNFWIFFAVGHPILQPILWISDVLHGTPGPKLADLVPYLFIAGNAVVIAAVAFSKEIRNAVNVAALGAFLAYVGAGLDGQAGLGDFNLQLDDSYKGQIVKGCPAYSDVRQPSMNNFDLEKYQGLWYEHKFHDWTQFKEVYDTTLDIKLTPDGKGWVDDFAVKGPAPDAAPLSWDKSPVANGAHYFLFGRVDENDPPGVLRESGFGVEFPNYIVDVQTDPATGEYKEAIQFQCLERGGVRVFEGINFMSRNPEMSTDELDAMHGRADKAGMYQYGASPEQMHTVARRGVGEPDVNNSWQEMWRFIGVDKLLELLTESIEDGGR